MFDLEQIAAAAEAVMKNAVQLYEEAQLLGTNGYFARSICLHQISNEECSKVDMLGALAVSVVLGHKGDQKKFEKALRSHAAKNRNNAYFAAVGEKERSATQEGNLETARQEFSALQEKLHTWFNNNKNNSLYVNIEGGCSATIRTPQSATTRFPHQ